MIGDDWILGWIVDSLANRFGKATVAGWITLGTLLVLAAAGVLFVLNLAMGRE